MDTRKVKVGLVQMGMSSSKDENLKKALGMIDDAVSQGAKIVALPELFATPYFCQIPSDKEAFASAEEMDGPTNKALAEAAKKHKIVLVGGSIFEKATNGKHYNTTTLFGPTGTPLGTYRKTHIPHDPGFYEQDYFLPGDTGVRVHDTPFGKIAILICYDQWFPEAARIATLKGAEIIFYPTAIATSKDIPPATPGIKEDWELMWRSVQVGHAAANCVYVAAINRTGDEGGMHFWGGSFIADPSAILLTKGDDTEQVLLAEVDLGHVKRMQDNWRFLLERRPEMYADITKKK